MSTLQDANATMVAVNTPPSEHPNACASWHNNAKSPFLRLPLEIRLEIYELAVKEKVAIQPRQVTKGSNLFVWGEAKAIYADLRERPVFYRVNAFKFSCPREIHDYLAALTPARRNAIRDITCVYPLNISAWWYRESLNESDFNDVLPILTHCRDLRSFKIIKKHSAPLYLIAHHNSGVHASVRNNYLEDLRRMVTRAEKDNGHDATVWSLPSLSVNYHFSGASFEPFTKELTDFKVRLQQALTRRQRAPNRTDLKAFFTPDSMKRAVQMARVDLVGEVRLTRDRGEADDAPIARRTRGQKEAKQTINKYGTLKSPIGPKYDFNGHLQWNFERIKEVRWSSHTIECQVAYFSDDCDPKGQAWPSSYEPLHVLGTEYGLERLRVYYQSFFAFPEYTLAAVEQRIEQMQSMPSPKDCAQELPEMMAHKPRRSMWKSTQNSWAKMLPRLRLRARDMAKLGGEGEEVQSAEPGDKREAENTIHCAPPPSKKTRT